jgi:hypothetical protein
MRRTGTRARRGYSRDVDSALWQLGRQLGADPAEEIADILDDFRQPSLRREPVVGRDDDEAVFCCLFKANVCSVGMLP